MSVMILISSEKDIFHDTDHKNRYSDAAIDPRVPPVKKVDAFDQLVGDCPSRREKEESRGKKEERRRLDSQIDRITGKNQPQDQINVTRYHNLFILSVLLFGFRARHKQNKDVV